MSPKERKAYEQRLLSLQDQSHLHDDEFVKEYKKAQERTKQQDHRNAQQKQAQQMLQLHTVGGINNNTNFNNTFPRPPPQQTASSLLRPNMPGTGSTVSSSNTPSWMNQIDISTELKSTRGAFIFTENSVGEVGKLRPNDDNKNSQQQQRRPRRWEDNGPAQFPGRRQ